MTPERIAELRVVAARWMSPEINDNEALPEALDEIELSRRSWEAAEHHVLKLRGDLAALNLVSDERAGNIAALEVMVASLEARLASAAAELDEADAAVTAALGVIETVPERD